MDWLLLLIAVIVAMVLLWRYLGSQVHGRNKTRADIEHGIKSMLWLCGDGGYLQARHRESPLCLRISRESGTDTRAELLFRLDDASAPLDLKRRLQVPDIWVEGFAQPADEVAQELLDAAGVRPDARFDLTIEGPRKPHGLRLFRRRYHPGLN
jgi:hypothetical protein